MEFERELVVLFDRVQVRYYGVIIVVAMLVAATVAARLARREGRDPDHIWGALTWAIIPAIIGARLWFVLFPPASLVEQGLSTAWFFQNFFNVENGAIAIWSGGLSIFGAVIGGLLGSWLYFSAYHNRITGLFGTIAGFWRFGLIILGVILIAVWVTNQTQTALLVIGIVAVVSAGVAFIPAVRQRLEAMAGPEVQSFPDEGLPLAPWLDIAAVALPLGQAIGRWANFVNQELYGLPTDLPWGITIDSAHRVAPYRSLVDYPLSQGFHPLFLYESLWSLLFFIILLNVFLRYRHRLFTGDVFLIYLMQYAFIRFLLESIRLEVTLIGNINLSQAFMAVVFVAALLFLVYRHRPGAAPVQHTPPEPPQTASENS